MTEGVVYLYHVGQRNEAAMEKRFEITVCGHLPPEWSAVFDGMQVDCQAGGQTRISGVLPDQAALYGLLLRIHDLGLSLVSVNSQCEAERNNHNGIRG
jgi:hypothetical protein